MLVAALYWPATAETLHKWQSSITYSHGYLLAPIAIWYAMSRSTTTNAFDLKTSPLLVGLAMSLGAIWFVGYAANAIIVQMAVLPALIWSGLSLVFGWPAARTYIIPIGLLYFCVPIWDYGNFMLQDLAIVVVGNLLDLAQRPVMIDGTFIHIRAGTFEIESGCSGLHYMIIALALAAIFACQNLEKTGNRIRLMMLAGFLALIANWTRIFAVILAGDFTDMQHFLVRVDHYYFGWVVFFVVLMPFFLYSRSLSAAEDLGRDESSEGADELPERFNVVEVSSSRRRVRGGAAFLVISLWPVIAYGMHLNATVTRTSPIAPPDHFAEWAREEYHEPVIDWSPEFVGASQEYLGAYARGTYKIDVYLNVYASEKQEVELVGYQNHWYDQKHWRLRGRDTIQYEGKGNSGSGKVLSLARGERSRVIITSYVIGDRVIAGDSAAKFAGALNRIVGPTLSGAIAISIRCTRDCELEKQVLADFANENMPRLREVLSSSMSAGNES